MREPTLKEINDACLNFRHDFGIVPEEERETIRLEAKEWLRAWLKVVEDSAEKSKAPS
jgi:hypothetical protein